MSVTAGDIANQALVDGGIVGQGQTPSAADSNKAITLMGQMVAQWNRKRWLVYNLIDVAFTSTGAVSYTVGPGMNFNTPRPDRLENGCYFRQLNTSGPNTLDYPLGLIQSHEDYTRITLKNMGTWPMLVFYDSGYPTGNVYFWPVGASGQFEYHLLLKNQLTAITGPTQALNLPPEYQAAIDYNLQVRLRAAYRLPPDPMIVGLAKDGLNVIRGANVQIPTLRMPAAVIGNGYRYNVWSDQ